VRGDSMARIASHIDAPAARIIDARGQVLAAGFIDLHTHARRDIFEVPTADNYARQGAHDPPVEGPDGPSPIPFRPFLERVATTRVTLNSATFASEGPRGKPSDEGVAR
jgi:hypothetical protein